MLPSDRRGFESTPEVEKVHSLYNEKKMGETKEQRVHSPFSNFFAKKQTKQSKTKQNKSVLAKNQGSSKFLSRFIEKKK